MHGPLRRTSGDSGVLQRQLGGGYTLVGGPPDPGGPPPARGGHTGPMGQQNMRLIHNEESLQMIESHKNDFVSSGSAVGLSPQQTAVPLDGP